MFPEEPLVNVVGVDWRPLIEALNEVGEPTAMFSLCLDESSTEDDEFSIEQFYNQHEWSFLSRRM